MCYMVIARPGYVLGYFNINIYLWLERKINLWLHDFSPIVEKNLIHLLSFLF
jgi:hypothetical protein